MRDTDFMTAGALERVETTAEALAGLLGITPRRVRQLCEAGLIPKAGHGRYPLGEAIRGYVEHIRPGAVAAGPSAGRDHGEPLAGADLLALQAELHADGDPLAGMDPDGSRVRA